MIKSKRRLPIGLYIKYTITIILALLFLAPFVWMLALSIKTLANFYDFPPKLWVSHPQWSNFIDVLKQYSLFRFLLNSLFVSTTITLLQLILASMAAFAFAVLSFRGKNALFMTFLLSLMIPGTVILIPLFLVTQKLGLLDSYKGLILPFLFTGYGIFMLRQFFMSLPRDFFEAARMDGCSYFGIYARIYIPLSKPALATLGTLAFMSFYNSLLWPLVSTNSEKLKTIPVGIAGLVGQNNYIYPHLVMAGTTIMVIPGILIFMFLQRYFIQGVVMSGIKG